MTEAIVVEFHTSPTAQRCERSFFSLLQLFRLVRQVPSVTFFVPTNEIAGFIWTDAVPGVDNKERSFGNTEDHGSLVHGPTRVHPKRGQQETAVEFLVPDPVGFVFEVSCCSLGNTEDHGSLVHVPPTLTPSAVSARQPSSCLCLILRM